MQRNIWFCLSGAASVPLIFYLTRRRSWRREGEREAHKTVRIFTYYYYSSYYYDLMCCAALDMSVLARSDFRAWAGATDGTGIAA